jgi:hypothetical protein
MVHHLIDQNGDLVFYKLEMYKVITTQENLSAKTESPRGAINFIIDLTF